MNVPEIAGMIAELVVEIADAGLEDLAVLRDERAGPLAAGQDCLRGD